MEAAGFSVDDLVQFITEKAANSVQKFPFEVMYEGMVRSWVPLEGKKPLGVIFENYLITLKDSPVKLNWDEAHDYCRGVEIEGHTCTAGWIIFWKEDSIRKSLYLSIIPSLLFIESGIISGNILLLIFPVIFAPCHILISYMNAILI